MIEIVFKAIVFWTLGLTVLFGIIALHLIIYKMCIDMYKSWKRTGNIWDED